MGFLDHWHRLSDPKHCFGLDFFSRFPVQATFDNSSEEGHLSQTKSHVTYRPFNSRVSQFNSPGIFSRKLSEWGSFLKAPKWLHGSILLPSMNELLANYYTLPNWLCFCRVYYNAFWFCPKTDLLFSCDPTAWHPLPSCWKSLRFQVVAACSFSDLRFSSACAPSPLGRLPPAAWSLGLWLLLFVRPSPTLRSSVPQNCSADSSVFTSLF